LQTIADDYYSTGSHVKERPLRVSLPAILGLRDVEAPPVA
jgi:hypothetical protein